MPMDHPTVSQAPRGQKGQGSLGCYLGLSNLPLWTVLKGTLLTGNNRPTMAPRLFSGHLLALTALAARLS